MTENAESQAEKAKRFAELHVPGTPLILYNVWDAGGAKALVKAGAPAVATASFGVAAAHGYRDGQAIPLDFLLAIVSRITGVDAPVSVDFEGGYAVEPEAVAANVARVLDADAVGINFEDHVVGGSGFHAIDEQCARIAAAAQAGAAAGAPLFVNARTDLFLKEPDETKHAGLIAAAKERGAAYAEAGASGFFVPGLVDLDQIAEIVEASALPVNIIKKPGTPSIAELASVGVARISYGPVSHVQAMKDFAKHYQEAEASR